MDTDAVGRVDASHRIRTSRAVAVVLTLVVTLGLVGAAAAALGHRHPTSAATVVGDPSVVLGFDDASAARLGASKHLRLSFRVLGGPVYPGARRAMRVTVANPFGFAVRVMQIRPTTRSTSVVGCRPGWFKPTRFVTKKLRQGLLVKPHRTSVKKLSIRMVNLPTVNQDACKSARYTVSLRAVARRA